MSGGTRCALLRRDRPMKDCGGNLILRLGNLFSHAFADISC